MSYYNIVRINACVGKLGSGWEGDDNVLSSRKRTTGTKTESHVVLGLGLCRWRIDHYGSVGSLGFHRIRIGHRAIYATRQHAGEREILDTTTGTRRVFDIGSSVYGDLHLVG